MNQLNNKITGQTRKKVELVSTKSFELKGNLKLNSEIEREYYESLKSSIKEHGVLAPVIIDIETKKIISGHLRCLIALEVGCKYIPVVYEELEIANKVIDFYKQPKIESPIYQNYIYEFVTDLQRALSENGAEVEDFCIDIACHIHYFSMKGDSAFYAFHTLLNNIHADSMLEFIHTGVSPSALHENYIFAFINAVQSNFENLNQKGVQKLRKLAIAIFELYQFSEDTFDAFDNLLDNIYWGRIAD